MTTAEAVLSQNVRGFSTYWAMAPRSEFYPVWQSWWGTFDFACKGDFAPALEKGQTIAFMYPDHRSGQFTRRGLIIGLGTGNNMVVHEGFQANCSSLFVDIGQQAKEEIFPDINLNGDISNRTLDGVKYLIDEIIDRTGVLCWL